MEDNTKKLFDALENYEGVLRYKIDLVFSYETNFSPPVLALCIYAQTDSTMEAAREILKAGASKSTVYGLAGGWKKTKPTKNDSGVYRDDFGKLLHRAIAGRVQLAISHLPKFHSRFGMMMCAPNDLITVENVESSIEHVSARVAAYYILIEKTLTQKKFSALPYIACAMLCRFRALVSGQRGSLKAIQVGLAIRSCVTSFVIMWLK